MVQELHGRLGVPLPRGHNSALDKAAVTAAPRHPQQDVLVDLVVGDDFLAVELVVLRRDEEEGLLDQVHAAVEIGGVHVVFDGAEATGDHAELGDVSAEGLAGEDFFVDFSLWVALGYQLVVLWS